MTKYISSRLGSKLLDYCIILGTFLLALGFIFPFLWTLSCALKTGSEVVAFPPRLMPRAVQWHNFRLAWTTAGFGVFFRNSMIVSVLGIIGQLTSSLLVAYGFARFSFPGRGVLFLVCLSAMMMPVYVTIIPLFVLFRSLRWTDTLLPLIVPRFFASAFSVFLLRQFIMTIPYDFDESALMDGGGSLTILVRIIAPNIKPAVAAAALFAFQGIWDDFLGPMIFVDKERNFTVPIGLWFLKFQEWDLSSGPQDHLLMAGSVIAILPVLVMFLVAQSYFTEGVVMSGIKG